MGANKRFITALTAEEKDILNNFCEQAGTKKSKLIRSFIRALKDMNPDETQIIISDNKTVRTGNFLHETSIVGDRIVIGKESRLYLKDHEK